MKMSEQWQETDAKRRGNTVLKPKKTKFLVYGSVTEPRRAWDVGDIDLIVVCDDPTTIDLEIYEKLAEATGKPIDLVFETGDENFKTLGWYEPGKRWIFRRVFCVDDVLSEAKPMTFQQIVDNVAITRESFIISPKILEKDAYVRSRIAKIKDHNRRFDALRKLDALLDLDLAEHIHWPLPSWKAIKSGRLGR
jgi:predicted nucleotidyltransferase